MGEELYQFHAILFPPRSSESEIPRAVIALRSERFVSAKIGDNVPPGAVNKSRVPTREIVAVNTPGRDAIVSRMIWLRGKEPGNRNAHERCIYIHGASEEKRIGQRASFGCVRLRSKDGSRSTTSCTSAWPSRSREIDDVDFREERGIAGIVRSLSSGKPKNQIPRQNGRDY
jgi:hypothetical protein